MAGVRKVYRDGISALGGVVVLLLVGAALLYGYSLTMDVSTTDSDQNLVQFWAGVLLSATVVPGALVALVLALAAMDGRVRKQPPDGG